MNANMFKLNVDKTEIIIFTSQRNFQYIEYVELKIGDSNIKPSTSVNKLCATLDSKMVMDHHVNSMTRTCYSQLRKIRHIRKYLTTDASLNKLQIAQNVAACFMTKTPSFDHITPILKELHWLQLQIMQALNVICLQQ